jgi:hypothetical protein
MSSRFTLDEAIFRHETAKYDGHCANRAMACPGWIELGVAVSALGGLLIVVQADPARRALRSSAHSPVKWIGP